MKSTPVIIPSEAQAREFDAKLLLACFLAESGTDAYVGARYEIHANIHHLPPSIYVAKDFNRSSAQIFNTMNLLGHRIVAWDEEGLITHKPELYYRRRVAQKSISRVLEFYAWGENNKALLENAPDLPAANIYATGNPRGDLLRPEFKDFYAETVEQLQARYGKFILINSNFGTVNRRVGITKLSPDTSSSSQGHDPASELARFWQQRKVLLDAFIDVLPDIARHFPENKIIVRPHPSENHSLWATAAAGLKNIEVIHDGPVVPWLLAAGAMIHNGCSTGLETFLLGQPAISFEPTGIQPDTEPTGTQLAPEDLPNFLSSKAQSHQELFALIDQCLETNQPLPQTEAQWHELNKFLTATSGPYSSQRIAQHILDLIKRDTSPLSPPPLSRLSGSFRSRLRKVKQNLRYWRTGHKNGRAYNIYRYPGLELSEVQSKIARFTKITGKFGSLSVRQCRNQIFLVEKN